MITIEEAVLAYAAAWNENDDQMQRQLLEKCWTDDGVVISNHDYLMGREQLFENIRQFRHRCPHDRAVLTSGIDQHHNWFRFTAIVIRPDGSAYSEALDIGEVGPDGRICRIITFFGPLPPVLAKGQMQSFRKGEIHENH